MNGLGERIRKIRKSKKVTLVELAQITGVAQASLSRIETGVMMGTVESHKKIAEALGMGLAELYDGLDERSSDIAHQTAIGDQVTVLNDKVKVEALTINTKKKKIVPTLLTIAPDGEAQAEMLDRGCEKFYWVIDGSIIVTINNKEYALQKMHSIYFDASLSHKLKNTSPYPSVVFCAASPPHI